MTDIKVGMIANVYAYKSETHVGRWWPTRDDANRAANTLSNVQHLNSRLCIKEIKCVDDPEALDRIEQNVKRLLAEPKPAKSTKSIVGTT